MQQTTTVPKTITSRNRVVLSKQIGEDRWAILCERSDTYHPYVVASWYPWLEDKEWHQGSYYESYAAALKDYNSRNRPVQPRLFHR